MVARRNLTIFMLAAFLMACPAFAQSQDAGLSIRGDVLKPCLWSINDLKRQFAAEVQAIQFTLGENKQQRTGTGIPLLSLIKAAKLKTQKEPKHYDLSFLVIVEARDGYRAHFSFAELSSECGHANVWLFWDVDGKPLSGKEAPLRLVVSTDRDPDRCIYGIASITLVDGTQLANRLAAREYAPTFIGRCHFSQRPCNPHCSDLSVSILLD
jgi:hypothetical protein